jgi:hypothetical protein
MMTPADKPSTPKPRTGRGGARVRLLLAAAFVTLALVAPDLLLHLLAGILHLAWEVIHAGLGVLHLGFEHLLQEAFGLSRHGAQMVTAWIGLALILALGAWAGRKAWRAARLRAKVLRQEAAAVLAAAWMAPAPRDRIPGPANPSRDDR